MEPEEGTPLWRLQKLPAERGLQLLHKIIDGICGRTYPLYQDYHSVWDSTEWMHVLEDITTFFKAVVGKNLSDEEISQQLNQLNSSHQEAIMKCLKSRKDEIKKTLLEEIVDISSARLQDFDWQIKLALSSDKIASLQMPLLNLYLDVKENGEVKPYSVEMSKEELQKLINSLEAANKALLQRFQSISFSIYWHHSGII
ncbi:COMM domain-containing protein 8 isoform X1 [Bos indicus]|uniref:COMM domain-containing protein 8 isoform X1 n=1 Tax=Bos indicus TaxID=9915 RepID=A0A6P5BY60_BOSIN|nr:PREDICTED: COMM domain-containing protein 8 isoform X1 [Bos indicus]XP_027400220.1 COMM domain-containing protein 8 isoform X1 [Bos indicus x Bos taurus]XP_059743738.1 COMM domain-containing protein 8 isoform X1 [Bos taurus]